MVILRNDLMGFQKTFEVQATDFYSAAERAGDELTAKGYVRENFNVISVVRGHEVHSIHLQWATPEWMRNQV